MQFIGEPSGGTVAALKARDEAALRCKRVTDKPLRYSWFQTGSRCLGRLWSKGMSTIYTSACLPDTFKRASLRVAALHTWWEQRRQQEEGE